MQPDNIALAITGASGTAYALRLMEILFHEQIHIQLMISAPGRMVLAEESGLRLPAGTTRIRAAMAEYFGVGEDALSVYGKQDWHAPVASGSNPPDAMVVCPCTSGTLGEIAAGTSRALIERAADVALKERRKLILVVRETPLSAIHLENMLKLTRAGAVIMPASPGFYHQPQSIAEVVDYLVARILDHLGVAHQLMTPWGQKNQP